MAGRTKILRDRKVKLVVEIAPVLDRLFAISEHSGMKLVLEKSARKGLDKMSTKAARAMCERLMAIADAPNAKHANVKPLTGSKDAFRLRQGDWRAIYELDRAADEMRVVVIDVRGSAYR